LVLFEDFVGGDVGCEAADAADHQTEKDDTHELEDEEEAPAAFGFGGNVTEADC